MIDLLLAKQAAISVADATIVESAISAFADDLGIAYKLEGVDFQSFPFNTAGAGFDFQSMHKEAAFYLMERYWKTSGKSPAELPQHVVLVAVLAGDLRSEGGWLFGATDRIKDNGVQLSVISTFRVPANNREIFLERLARHEFGHAIGLVPGERTTHVEDKIGPHCTNLCLMRQGMTAIEFAELAQQEKEAGVLLCQECRSYVKERHA